MTDEQASLIPQLRNALHRYQFVVLAILAGIAGTALIVYQRSFPSADIARDFGVALFAAGTIALAVEFYTRRQFRELVREDVRRAVDASSLGSKLDEVLTRGSLGGDLRALGVRRIHRDRMAIDFAQLVKDAEPGTELRLLGVCLAGFVGRGTQLLVEEKLRQGCSLRLLILDPAAEAVRERAAEEGRAYEDLQRQIVGTDGLHRNFIDDGVPDDLRDRIELGHYDAVPKHFMVSTQNTMIVGFYLRGSRGEFFPQLELDIIEGGIHTVFSRHFESLWAARREASHEIRGGLLRGQDAVAKSPAV